MIAWIEICLVVHTCEWILPSRRSLPQTSLSVAGWPTEWYTQLRPQQIRPWESSRDRLGIGWPVDSSMVPEWTQTLCSTRPSLANTPYYLQMLPSCRRTPAGNDPQNSSEPCTTVQGSEPMEYSEQLLESPRIGWRAWYMTQWYWTLVFPVFLFWCIWRRASLLGSAERSLLRGKSGRG